MGYGLLCRLISREKSLQGYTRENNILHALKRTSLMTYIMLKKILRCYMSGKKFLTPEVWEKNSCPK